MTPLDILALVAAAQTFVVVFALVAFAVLMVTPLRWWER